MSFPFKPLPTSRQPFMFWPLPPAPASSPPSTPIIWELFHTTSAAMRRWACRFKLLPAARRPLPGHYHRLRRHRTVSADQLGHISPTAAATPLVGLFLQSATNRPGVIIVGNFAPSLQLIPATTPSSSLRKMLTPTPRAPKASPLAHFKGLLQRQRLHLHVRCGTRTFHRRVRYPPPSSTYHIELLQPRLLPSQSPYRIVREHPNLTGSCSELFNAFYWTIIRLQRSYHIFREHHGATVSRSERCSTP